MDLRQPSPWITLSLQGSTYRRGKSVQTNGAGSQLISRRYERGPMILTSNQSFGAWGDVFGDRVIATAILDRLLHHAVTLNIRGNSYRLKEKLKAGLVRSFDDETQPQPGGEI